MLWSGLDLKFRSVVCGHRLVGDSWWGSVDELTAGEKCIYCALGNLCRLLNSLINSFRPVQGGKGSGPF